MSTLPSQAVLLCAGESSRFEPFATPTKHKSEFVCMDIPVISRTIHALKRIGIKHFVIVKSSENTTLHAILEKCDIPFVLINETQPLGMADALLCAQGVLHERFLVINPQQMNADDHLSLLKKEKIEDDVLYLFTQETRDPKEYGVVKLNGNRVLEIVEKPHNLNGLSNQRIVGMYLLNSTFIRFLQQLPSSQYQFETALNSYAKENTIRAISTKFPALTLKHAWDIFDLSHYLFTTFSKRQHIHRKATVHPTALITGNVVIEEGARIYEYALVQGPCYIGKNAVVGSYCKVRNETILEEGVELQSSVEVKHSCIGAYTHIHSGYIGDSVIGSQVRIGAGFITANKRLDRENIIVKIKERMVDTHLSSLGVLLGDSTKIGIHCGANPGTIVHAHEVVLPMTLLSH